MQMSDVIIPEGYRSQGTLIETEIHIKKIKDFFEKELFKALNLTRVSAPLFVDSSSGLNDNMTGYERPIVFRASAAGKDVEIIQSLAKWRIMSLHRYGFCEGQGLYTDMHIIKKDDTMDNLHSIYVDQWGWEKVISQDERNEAYLKSIVRSIYGVFRITESFVNNEVTTTGHKLPQDIFFITAQELEDKYPDLNPREREQEICREHGAVFIMKIGDALKSGEKHDGRSPDYDDWNLNGDIHFWYPILNTSMEISSMGIRVNEEALERQLKLAGAEDRRELYFHKALLKGKLPYTVGGGIGQSRVCMYFLNKAHIGEVQASVWDEKIVTACRENGINLL